MNPEEKLPPVASWLTTEDLKGLRCTHDGCSSPEGHPVIPSPRCHPSSPLETLFYPDQGAVLIRRSRCKRQVATIAVSSGIPDGV